MSKLSAPSLDEIHALIRRFGPVMVMHSDEEYMMDYPDRLLGTEKASLAWGIVRNEDDYDSFQLERINSVAVSSGDALLAAVRRAKTDEKARDAGFRYWLNIADELKPGNQAQAKSLVIVTHLDSLHGDGRELIQLQF